MEEKRRKLTIEEMCKIRWPVDDIHGNVPKYPSELTEPQVPDDKIKIQLPPDPEDQLKTSYGPVKKELPSIDLLKDYFISKRV